MADERDHYLSDTNGTSTNSHIHIADLGLYEDSGSGAFTLAVSKPDFMAMGARIFSGSTATARNGFGSWMARISRGPTAREKNRRGMESRGLE